MLNRLCIIPIFIVVLLTAALSAHAADFCEKKTELYNRWSFSPGRAITESTDYIFYGDGDIVSVMDKNTLAPVSSIHIEVSEGITGIDYNNGYLFVTTGFNGLQSIQVESDGTLTLGSPLAIKSTVDDDVSIYTRGVHVSGSYAFLGIAEVTSEGNINLGVQVVDISNPGSPAIPAPDPAYPDDPFGGRGELVGTENIPYGRAETLGIRVSGNYAYVVDWLNGLQIFNIENKKKPLFVGLAIAPDARDAQIVGDYAFVACANYGLIVVNISNPESTDNPINQRPTLQCLYDWEETFARSVFISGDYAYMADNYDRLQVVDISGDLDEIFATSNYRDNPQYGEQFLVGSLSTGLSGPYSVLVSDSFAYVAEFETGLHKIDVSDPTSPSSTSLTFDKTAVADSFYLYNFNDTNYAYMVNSNGADEGLRILQFDISLAMRLTAFIETPGEAQGVYVKSETNDNGSVSLYAYIADGTNGLQIIDVTSSSVPVMKGVYTGANQAREVYVRGNYAYVADGTNGLRIINITDKDSPRLTGTLPTTEARDIIVPTGDYAYVADGTGGLVIVDISERSSPVEAATINTPGEANAVYIYGNYAFVADGSEGLQVISLDESNSSEYHTIVGAIATDAGEAQGIYVVDNYAHVADGTKGFQTFDVSNPSSPVKIYSDIDCDDDGIPNEKGWFWNTKGYAKDLVIDDEGEYVIVADGPGGLSLFRLTDEDADLDDATIEPSEGVDDCFISSVSGEPNRIVYIFYYILLLMGLAVLIEFLFTKIKHINS
jgi:hypothetical protein